MNITGSCHCGELSFTARVDTEKVMVCHCTDCQVLSASAFRTVVMSEPNELTFNKGTPKEYIKIAESGNERAQGFCQNCGTAIYATSVGEGDRVYGIRVGCVDQKAELSPKIQIWCQSKVTWLNDINNMKAFSKTP